MRMSSMKDLRKKEEEEENNNSPRNGQDGRGPNNYYAGSGLNVVDPKSKPDDPVSSIMSQKPTSDAARGSVVIKFYKNGFTIDDGELHRNDDPKTKAFMDSIQRGQIPLELLGKPGVSPSELDVSVEDHRSEEYVEPAYRAFSGEGASLGGSSRASGAVVSASSAGSVVVDESQPTTTIQVKLLNGKREKIVLNLTNTVQDLFTKVASLNASGGKAFTLSSGFPPKQLDNLSSTIEAAGLKNAAVTQGSA